MLARKHITGLNGIAIFVMLCLLALGVVTLYSIEPVDPFQAKKMPFYVRQLVWMGVGMVAFVLMAWIDYHVIIRWAYPLYGLSLVLLVGVMLTGQTVGGARRWISLGFISFQPSELAKISVLLALAKIFSVHPARKGLSVGALFLPIAFILPPTLLVLKQPDLGTALAMLSILMGMVFVLGLRSKVLVYTLLLSILTLPFSWLFFWNHLKDYQKNRLMTFVDPGRDPSGSGYHINQSKIAIGSGQLWGKGLGEGTQSQLKFLPAGHTDFIFSVYAETWGWIGVALLLALFLFLVLWGLWIALRAKNLLGSLLAVGIVSLFAFHGVVNIGMALGSLPTVGIPLPLISYGGTAMVTTLGLLGMLLNINLRRLMLFY